MLKNALNILQYLEPHIVTETDALLRLADDGLVQIFEHTLNVLLQLHRLVNGDHQVLVVLLQDKRRDGYHQDDREDHVRHRLLVV